MSSALTLSSPARFARTNNYWHYQPRIRAGFCTLERPDRCLKDRVHLRIDESSGVDGCHYDLGSASKNKASERNKMNHNKKNMNLAIGLISVMLAGLLVEGCSQTAAPAPNIIRRVQGETPAPPPPSGFLGSDYSLLTPPAEGSDQKAMLRYVNPDTKWSSYNKILIAPV